jgi:hypothetical protein
LPSVPATELLVDGVRGFDECDDVPGEPSAELNDDRAIETE